MHRFPSPRSLRLAPLVLGLTVVSCLGEHPPEQVLHAYPLEAGWVRTYSRELSIEGIAGGGRLVLVDAARVTALGPVGADELGNPILSLRYELISGGTAPAQEEWFSQDPGSLRRVIPGPAVAAAGASAPGESRMGMAGMLRSVLLEGLDRLVDENTLHTLLAYPLVPGNSWVARERVPVVLRQVEGFETVTVPAGRFRTVRLLTRVLTRPPIEYVDWIAAEGLVRRHLDVRLDEYGEPAGAEGQRIIERVELESLQRP